MILQAGQSPTLQTLRTVARLGHYTSHRLLNGFEVEGVTCGFGKGFVAYVLEG